MRFDWFPAAVLLAVFTLPGYAHDDAYLATLKAPHGGQLRMAGPYHYELVFGEAEPGTAQRTIVVHITDHADHPVATQGAQGVAYVVANGERGSVKLLPDGANRMKGAGRYESTGDAEVVVSITMPGAEPAQARFPLAVAGTPASVDPQGAAHGQDHHHDHGSGH